jgi:hypothetical protein
MRTIRIIVRRSCAAALLGGVFACGGGGSGDSRAADILMTDTPATDLLAFHATVQEVRLVRQGGATTGNLIDGPVPLEWIELHHRATWLARKAIPVGTYKGMVVQLDPDSIVGRQTDGADVAIEARSTQIDAPFDTPLEVGGADQYRLVVDLDLASSLLGSVDGPPLQLMPVALATSDRVFEPIAIQPVSGKVASSSMSVGDVELVATADGDGAVPLGAVHARLGGSPLLVRDDGNLFPTTQDFFDSLVDGQTNASVSGTLANGVLQASRVEIDDNAAGGGHANLVRMNGVILGVGEGNSANVAIANVGQGSSIVAPAFGGAIPGTLGVNFDTSTAFFLGDDQTTNQGTLAVGQVVSAKFATFTNAPFTSSAIGIQSTNVPLNGTISSVTGVPASMAGTLSPFSPSVLAGEAESPTVPVTIDLTNSDFVLDTSAQPHIPAESFLPGMNFQAQGSIHGSPSEPTITSMNTVIFPGELMGATVTGTSAGAFTVTGGTFTSPFGGDTGTGPITATIAPNAVFHGVATTPAGFDSVFSNLAPGQSMTVQIKGIGTATNGTVVAHEVTTSVGP